MQLELLSQIDILYKRKQNITNLLDLISGNPNHRTIYLYKSQDVNNNKLLQNNLLEYLNNNKKGIFFEYSNEIKKNEINIYVEIFSTSKVELQIDINDLNKKISNPLVIIALRIGEPKFKLPIVQNTKIFEINYGIERNILETQYYPDELMNYILGQNTGKQNIPNLPNKTDNTKIIYNNTKSKTIYLYCSSNVIYNMELKTNLLKYLNENKNGIIFEYSNEIKNNEIYIYVEIIMTSRISVELLNTNDFKKYISENTYQPVIIALRFGTNITDNLPQIENRYISEINYGIVYNIIDTKLNRDSLINHVLKQMVI